jgi:dTDP-4-amino-4,6-dideoxygalactose transaminase
LLSSQLSRTGGAPFFPSPMADDSLFSFYPAADEARHRDAIAAAVTRTLGGGWYILGPEVEAFEREFATWIGVRHAIGVANGTDAIELLLRAHGIGAGNQVIVPSLTAVATASAVIRAGATPIFADVDPVRGTITPDSVKSAIAAADSSQVKAVVAVHLYGHPADITGLRAVCDAHGLNLFEDCAQAHGAEIGGRRVGGLADGAAFSFYPTKNLGALGDGGAVTTDDDSLAIALRELRQYGWRRRYISERPGGVNSRLDELQAAVLRVKLPSLDEQIEWRRQLADRYASGLAGLSGITTPATAENCGHAFHLYVIQADHRDALMAHLQQAGVPVALHYPAAVHEQPAFAAEAALSPALPETERLIQRILTLPLHGWLPEAAVDATIESIRSFCP